LLIGIGILVFSLWRRAKQYSKKEGLNSIVSTTLEIGLRGNSYCIYPHGLGNDIDRGGNHHWWPGMKVCLACEGRWWPYI
jgi:hypothetical protein